MISRSLIPFAFIILGGLSSAVKRGQTPVNVGCGFSTIKPSKIPASNDLTGIEPPEHSLPWIVNIKNGDGHVGTGVLIQHPDARSPNSAKDQTNPRKAVNTATQFVLTVASVIKNALEANALESYKVVVGGHYQNQAVDGEVEMEIEGMAPTQDLKDNDFVVLKLKEPVSYTKTVQAICLQTQAESGVTRGYLAGWGDVTVEDQTEEKKAQQPLSIVSVPIEQGNSRCRAALGRAPSRDDFCTPGLQYADAGSPIILFKKTAPGGAKQGAVLHGLVTASGGSGISYRRVDTAINAINGIIRSTLTHGHFVA